MSCHHSFRKSLLFHEVGPAAYLPRLICCLLRDPSYVFFFMDTSDLGHGMATERVDMEAAHNVSNVIIINIMIYFNEPLLLL